jgi:CRP-like cAMP-binding protein
MADRLLQLVLRVPLFASLGPEGQRAVAAIARTQRYAPGKHVFRQGDPSGPLFAVLSGYLKRTVTGREGRDIVLTMMGPGELFGEISLLDGAPRSATISAVAAAEVLVIEREAFLEFLQTHPEAAIKLLQVLAARVRRLSDEREEIASLDIAARVAKKLTELAAQFGEASESGELRIGFRLSQQDLGNWVGATRESVNKSLKRLNQRGLLRLDAGYILVSDVPGLKQLACSE